MRIPRKTTFASGDPCRGQKHTETDSLQADMSKDSDHLYDLVMDTPLVHVHLELLEKPVCSSVAPITNCFHAPNSPRLVCGARCHV